MFKKNILRVDLYPFKRDLFQSTESSKSYHSMRATEYLHSRCKIKNEETLQHDRKVTFSYLY